MDKFGYWIMNDVVKPIIKGQDHGEDGDPDVEIFTDDPDIKEKLTKLSEAKKIHGSCILSIRFNTHGEYLKWKKYFGNGQQWDFLVNYPAIMRAEYQFTNSLEVEVMAKKVVQLLEAGFDVYSASWTLDRPKEEEEENGEQGD